MKCITAIGGEAGWKFRYRYHADGTLSAKWMRMKFALRERFQHTWNREEKEFRLRSRLKISYDIRHCKAEPYASVEMYNGLGRGEGFGVARMRYRAGVTLNLTFIGISVNAVVPCEGPFSSDDIGDIFTPGWESTRFSAAVLFNFG